jgi:ribosomal protein S18 acetylase RimI-like enzyme
MAASAVTIERRGADAIAELEPLWLELKNHHGACTPSLPVRRDYERWLAEPGAFLLLARQAGRAVGYALVRIEEAGPTWIEPERVAIVQDISVAARARGAGIGRALLDRVGEESGADVMQLAVLGANASAKAFYERLGFEPFVETLRRRTQ